MTVSDPKLAYSFSIHSLYLTIFQRNAFLFVVVVAVAVADFDPPSGKHLIFSSFIFEHNYDPKYVPAQRPDPNIQREVFNVLQEA